MSVEFSFQVSSDRAAGEVHKLCAKKKKKQKQTNFFPVRTEQASSKKVLLLRLLFEFPNSIAHLRNHCFYYAIFAEFLPKCLGRQHKSTKSIGKRSILAVRTAKFGPLREPIRMLLFTLDQFSHIINLVICGQDVLMYLLSSVGKKRGLNEAWNRTNPM